MNRNTTSLRPLPGACRALCASIVLLAAATAAPAQDVKISDDVVLDYNAAATPDARSMRSIPLR